MVLLMNLDSEKAWWPHSVEKTSINPHRDGCRANEIEIWLTVGNDPDPSSHEASSVAIESPESVVREVIEGWVGVMKVVKMNLCKFSSSVDGGQ